MPTVKKPKKNFKMMNIIIPLMFFILAPLETFNPFKNYYIKGTIIYKNNNYIEIITPNDSIYKLNNNIEFTIGDTITIKYKKTLNDFKDIQNIIIKEITKTNAKLDYSEKTISIVNKMSLKEKIGQLLLVRVPETNKLETIKNYNIGGYLLFQRDIGQKAKETIKNEINEYQSTSKIPLLIAIDEEGGTVSRLSYNKNLVETPFLSPKDLYNNGGFEAIKQDAINKNILLKELGINMNLAPVTDITTNPDSFMYKRSFGNNKTETAEFIKTILSTQDKEVSYVLKHFPGYSNNIDTHTSVAIDNRDYQTIKNNDLIPFKIGINKGANAILVSHNIVTCIEDKPSSLSRNIHNILRNALNFKGIIITDDLSMDAIKGYDTSTPYKDAVLAGNNILIVTDYAKAYEEIYNSVTNGNISEELITRLVYKNIQFKINLNLYK